MSAHGRDVQVEWETLRAKLFVAQRSLNRSEIHRVRHLNFVVVVK